MSRPPNKPIRTPEENKARRESKTLQKQRAISKSQATHASNEKARKKAREGERRMERDGDGT